MRDTDFCNRRVSGCAARSLRCGAYPQGLYSVGGGGDHWYVQSTVHPGPTGVVGVVAERVLGGRVQVGGLDVQRDPPTPAAASHGCEQNARPAFAEHAPQLARVVEHLDGADTGQGDRTRPVLPEADRRPHAVLGLGGLVPHPKGPALVVPLLEPRVPDGATRTLAAPGVGPRLERPAEVDDSFFEDLSADLRAPSQARNLNLGLAGRVDDEPAPSRFCLLPRVERIDQVEPRPRHPSEAPSSPLTALRAAARRDVRRAFRCSRSP